MRAAAANWLASVRSIYDGLFIGQDGSVVLCYPRSTRAVWIVVEKLPDGDHPGTARHPMKRAEPALINELDLSCTQAALTGTRPGQEIPSVLVLVLRKGQLGSRAELESSA